MDRNWKIWPLIISVPIFHTILMYSPVIQEVFATIGMNFALVPLGAVDWLTVLVFGLTPVCLIELMKMLWIRREKTKSNPAAESLKKTELYESQKKRA